MKDEQNQLFLSKSNFANVTECISIILQILKINNLFKVMSSELKIKLFQLIKNIFSYLEVFIRTIHEKEIILDDDSSVASINYDISQEFALTEKLIALTEIYICNDYALLISEFEFINKNILEIMFCKCNYNIQTISLQILNHLFDYYISNIDDLPTKLVSSHAYDICDLDNYLQNKKQSENFFISKQIKAYTSNYIQNIISNKIVEIIKLIERSIWDIKAEKFNRKKSAYKFLLNASEYFPKLVYTSSISFLEEIYMSDIWNKRYYIFILLVLNIEKYAFYQLEL